jgi:hypothetical protein
MVSVKTVVVVPGPLPVEYVRLAAATSPSSVMVLVTQTASLAEGAAGVLVVPLITGGVSVTVTEALPLTVPLVAVTLPLAFAPGAVKRPEELTTPPATVVVQISVGGGAKGLPNWSLDTALNCLIPPTPTLAVVGLTTMPVRIWFTVTLTWLVTDRPPGSAMLTVKP